MFPPLPPPCLPAFIPANVNIIPNGQVMVKRSIGDSMRNIDDWLAIS
jgi:hypothetical protein